MKLAHAHDGCVLQAKQHQTCASGFCELKPARHFNARFLTVSVVNATATILLIKSEEILLTCSSTGCEFQFCVCRIASKQFCRSHCHHSCFQLSVCSHCSVMEEDQQKDFQVDLESFVNRFCVTFTNHSVLPHAQCMRSVAPNKSIGWSQSQIKSEHPQRILSQVVR